MLVNSALSDNSLNKTDVWQLKQEVLALEELSRQLFLEAHDMHNMRERLDWALTWKGKYFNCLGYFFSLYCMWKIIIVSIVDKVTYFKCLLKIISKEYLARRFYGSINTNTAP